MFRHGSNSVIAIVGLVVSAAVIIGLILNHAAQMRYRIEVLDSGDDGDGPNRKKSAHSAKRLK